MPKYFYHKSTGRMYEIVGQDPATGSVTLKTEMATFSDTFDKDRFKQQGYTLVDGKDEAEARAKGEAKVVAEGGEPVRPASKSKKPEPVTAPPKKAKVAAAPPPEPEEDEDEDMGLGGDEDE